MKLRKQSFRNARQLIKPDLQLVHKINNIIVKWGPVRLFPWRTQKITPYQTLVTETLLIRTSAEAVSKVIEQIWASYGTPESMKRASVREIEMRIEPIGLIKRAQMLHNCAIVIFDKGSIPTERKSLLELPGVGEYVADAVRLFAFDIPVVPIDAVIGRVFRRILGYPENGPAYADKSLWNAVQIFSVENERQKLVAAILDIGALICTPSNPKCLKCPLSDLCIFYWGETNFTS
jgi:A/G-specific adenine glycosylase